MYGKDILGDDEVDRLQMEAPRGVESRSTNISTYLLFFSFFGWQQEASDLFGNHSLGGFCDGGTPDPIPNSAVKPVRADGTSL